MAVVLNTQVLLDPNNQIAHLADWTGLVVGTEYLISGQFLVADTRFEFHGFSDIALTRNPVGVPQAQTEVPAVVSTTPQPAAASPPAAYPFKVNDRLVADNLNNGFEFNAAATPPNGNGGGAGMYNQWVDLSTAGRAYLRQCAVPQAKAGVYDAAEWVQLGYTDLATKKFWFDGTNVGFQNGIVIGSGGITVTNPDAPAPYVKLKGDTMSGRLLTPDLAVQSTNAGGYVSALINNLAAGANAFAGLLISTNNGGRSANIHIHDANPEFAVQLGTGVDKFIVWSNSIRRVGGFGADGWVKSLDARNIVYNDGNYGQMANGDGTIAIFMGGGSNHAFYRNAVMHHFQFWDGSADWLTVQSNLVTAQNQVNAVFFNASSKVNAIWYDINGALFADRRNGNDTIIYDGQSVKRLTLALNNANYHYADVHQFTNKADNTPFVTITNNIDVLNGLVRVRGTLGEFQFQDRSGTNYFGWSTQGTTAQLYSSYVGNVVFQVHHDGHAWLNGIEFGNNGGRFWCNSDFQAGGAVYANATAVNDFSLFVNYDNGWNRYVSFQTDCRWAFITAAGDLRYELPGRVMWYFYQTGVTLNNISYVAGHGPYADVSDIRFKDESSITPSSIGLTEVMKLNPVTFKRSRVITKWESDEVIPNRTELGFIAQEVQEALPDAVVQMELDDGPALAYETNAIIAAMVNAFKEVDARLKALEGT